MAIVGLFNMTNSLANGYQIEPDVLKSPAPKCDFPGESCDSLPVPNLGRKLLDLRLQHGNFILRGQVEPLHYR